MRKNWKTKLIHPDAHAPEGFRSLSMPTYRGSTVLFPNAAAVEDTWDQHEVGYTYGLYGTPTTLELAARICELEKGYRTFITPGGQGAIALINIAFLKAGDHVLVPESVYTPNRKFALAVLRRFGVEVTFYPPTIGAGIPALFRNNTRLVWCESPGSITMEVQDIPAIADATHRIGAMVALDNTWAAGVYFDAFAHGVDVTMQALTKYVGGHSDLLLGSITVRDEAAYKRLGATPSPTYSFDAGAAWAMLALQATYSGWQAHGMAGFDRERAFVELNVPHGFSVEAAIAIGRVGDPTILPERLQAREFPSHRHSLADLVLEGGFPG